MRPIEKVMRVGRATVFAVGLALAAGLTVALVTVLGDPFEQANNAIAPFLAVGQTMDRSTSEQESVDESGQDPVGEIFNRTELYFGSEKPDGSEVPEEEFEQFVDDEVTPSFPDGLTLLTGKGQFRAPSGGIIEEPSHVLIVLYPSDDREANYEIQK